MNQQHTPPSTNKKRLRSSPGNQGNTTKKSKSVTVVGADTYTQCSSNSDISTPSSSSDNIMVEQTMLKPEQFAELLRSPAVQEVYTEMIETALQKTLSKNKIIERLTVVEKSCTLQQNEVVQLQARVDTLEQQGRRDAAIFSGLPEIQDEDPRQTIVKFANDYLHINLTDDIRSAYRLGKKKTNSTTPRPILVKLSSADKKIEVYKARSSLRKMDIGQEHIYKNPVYISEDLVPGRALLFKEARKQVKDGKAFSSWSMDGSIWIKLSRDATPTRISNLLDLMVLLKLDKITTRAEETTPATAEK